MPFELVIFDCDGVLVDSERLAVREEVAVLAELGWPLSFDEVIERFVGRSAADIHAEIEAVLGVPIDFDALFVRRCEEVFERELRAVDGIDVALAAIPHATCVASSGRLERVARSLAIAGLHDQFEGFGKPAPDLFLHAAARMGVEPSSCAVVEDSAAGVTAGCAAGMAVFAYAGGVTSRAALHGPDVIVFDDMRDLPGLLARST